MMRYFLNKNQSVPEQHIWLQPPFFWTGALHLGQGLEMDAMKQVSIEVSFPDVLSDHSRAISQVASENLDYRSFWKEID